MYNYHFFEYRNYYFLLHAETLQLFKLDEELYKDIRQWRETEKTPNPSLQQILNEMGISIEAPGHNLSDNAPYSKSAVTQICLNVSQTCNLNCVYCYGDDGEYGRRGLMKSDIAFKAVDWLIKFSGNKKTIIITFFGGEPLLNFNLIKKVVEYAKGKAPLFNKKVLFTITTNGCFLDNRVIDFLNQENFSIVVSCDGDLKAQQINRPFKSAIGSHKIIENNIANLISSRKLKTNTSARITVTKQNADLQTQVAYLSKLGFKKVNWAEAIFSSESSMQEQFKLTSDDYNEILEYFDYLADTTIVAIKKREYPSDTRLIPHIIRLHNKTKRYFFCGVGRGIVGISIDGDIYPCHRFVGNDDYKIGNVKLENALEYKSTLNLGVKNNICSACWARYFCGGGCVHEYTYSANSEQNIPSEEGCNLIKKSVESAIFVYNSLSSEDKEFLFKRDKRNKEIYQP